MKLRNKKTGKRGWIAEFNNNFIVVYPVNERWEADSEEKYVYHSLSEVCEDWEDVKEPLTKDENIRKAIRTWAAAANVKTDKIRVSKGTFFTSFIGWIDGLVGGLEISFRTGDAFEAINDGAEVTLAELCGEEE